MRGAESIVLGSSNTVTIAVGCRFAQDTDRLVGTRTTYAPVGLGDHEDTDTRF